MGDAVTVAVGGRLAVSVDDLLVDAGRLELAAGRFREWSARAALLVLRSADGPPAPDGHGLQLALDETRRMLDRCADESERLARWLRLAGDGYGLAERAASALWELGGRAGAWLLGTGAALNPMLAGTVVATAAAGAALASGFDPERLVSDPRFVRFVRGAVDAADDAALAAALAPLVVALPALGPVLGAALAGGVAVVGGVAAAGGGATANARGVRRLAAALPGDRMLVETPVVVRPVAVGVPVRPPTSYAELAERVPSVAAGGPQLRVEHYPDGWFVYLGGTADFSPVPTDEPWDLTSDVGLLAGGPEASGGRPDSGLQRAAEAALRDAGYRPGEPIVTVGHSAGGMAAARLAQDPALTVVAGLNLGGAVAGMDTPGGVPFVSVEHEEDLVPALAGYARDDDPERVTVTRSLFDGTGPPAGSEGLPAHALVRYRETAALMDDSDDPDLARMLETVRSAGGGTGTASTWRADRVPG